MKKLTIVTAVAALVATFGFSGGASAHFPGVCKKADPPETDHADCHALLEDGDVAEPLTLGALCFADPPKLTGDTKIKQTIETGANEIKRDCLIDIAGNDLAIQQAMIKVGGYLTIEDTGVDGLVAIIASDLDVAGAFQIDLMCMSSCDVTVTRNIPITVGTDFTIDTTGSVNVRGNLVTSGTSGAVLTISGDAGVSIKSNEFTDHMAPDFGTINICSSEGEVFVHDNDLGGATVFIVALGGDCSVRGNMNGTVSLSLTCLTTQSHYDAHCLLP